MAAKRRDISKASASTDQPSRKPAKRQQRDRAVTADFGDLRTRPSPPPQPAAKGRKLMKDCGPSEMFDLPQAFSGSFGSTKRR